jgi:hypothetical protein
MKENNVVMSRDIVFLMKNSCYNVLKKKINMCQKIIVAMSIRFRWS